MKLSHWNIISPKLPTIYVSERFLVFLCAKFVQVCHIVANHIVPADGRDC